MTNSQGAPDALVFGAVASNGLVGVSETESLLFANDAFYRAFADRDVEAMADVWSREWPVSCLHPGWGPLFDRSEVISSWAAILSSPDAPKIRFFNPRAQIYGDVGTVICFEQLQGGVVVATNIFVREGSLWKLIHHQGGATSTPAPLEEASGAAIH